MINNKMNAEAAPAQVGSPLDVVITALGQNKWDHASEQARALLEAAPALLAALKAIAAECERQGETDATYEIGRTARAAIAHTGGDK
jgi:hypothetical protein